jgi:hypothetical protein
VHHVVGPAVDALRRSGPGTSWFFMRYWQHGPHVRLRVAGLAHRDQPALDRLLRAAMAEVLAAAGGPMTAEEYRRHAAPLAAAGEGGRALDPGCLLPPGVYRHRYRPEVARYGGPGLLPLSEVLFEEASQMALAFIALDPPESARSGLGLRATWAALDALADDDERVRFCRRAVTGWQEWGRSGGAGDIPAAPVPGRPDGPAPAPVRRWADQLGQAMGRWRVATGEQAAQRILRSHIHMLHNRLGLSVGHEWMHYRALAGSAVAA